MIEELLQQHRELLDLASELEHLTNDNEPAVPLIAQLRWQLSSLVGKHLAAQDEAMRLLARHGLKSNEQAIFDAYFADLVDLRLSFADHNARWTLTAVRGDWLTYGLAAREQTASLGKRIVWEEQFLFPLLRRLAAIQSERDKAA